MPPVAYYYGLPALVSCYIMTAIIAFISREFALLLACVNRVPDGLIGFLVLGIGFSIGEVLVLRRTARKSPFIEGQTGCDQTLGFILAVVAA